jgi:hypothetical protein
VRNALLVIFAACLLPALLRTVPSPKAGAEAPQRSRPVLIIVHTAPMTPAAERWSAHRMRQGWSVDRLLSTEPEGHDPRLLRQRLRGHATRLMTAGAPGVAILLLGDSDAIPTFRFAQADPRLIDDADPEFASDHPYQLLDDADELPDLALGRVPARNVEAALSVLEKILRYEAAAPEAAITASPDADGCTRWRHRLTFVAGEGRFGPADSILETLFRTLVDRMVPERFELTMTYAAPTSIYCPPPSALEETIARRFAEPALWVNYLGHGFAEGLDRMRWGAKRIPMLTSRSLEHFQEPRDSLPIAFFGCCSVGWFDRSDGAPSLAERLLEAPGGPVAIIAGSRPTHPYGTAVLQKDLIRRLLHDRTATVGALDLESTRSMLLPDSDDAMIDLIARPMAAIGNWPCSLQELRLMHVRMYNLLGDPCTRIALPPEPKGAVHVDGRVLRGEARGMIEGRADIVLETVREASASGPLRAAPSRDAPDLEERASANYPRANVRILWQGSTVIREGRYELLLPDPLPVGAAILRSVVRGRDAGGAALEGLEALRLATAHE